MSSVLLFSLCVSITNFNPPGVKHDLSKWQKKKACEYSKSIKKAADKNNIDVYTYMGLILVESGFNRKVVSKAGACGLTQVLPKYLGKYSPVKKKYTCKQLKNPRTSIAVGAKILNYWIHTYGNGDTRVGLCGYNTGYRCKKTKRRKKPHKGGMRYADKVLLMAEYFRKASL